MDAVTILSLVIGILGLIYAIYSSRQLTKSMKIGVLRQVRTMINRLDAEKKKHSSSSPEYSVMDHTQEDLEDVFKSIQVTFRIRDKDVLK